MKKVTIDTSKATAIYTFIDDRIKRNQAVWPLDKLIDLRDHLSDALRKEESNHQEQLDGSVSQSEYLELVLWAVKNQNGVWPDPDKQTIEYDSTPYMAGECLKTIHRSDFECAAGYLLPKENKVKLPTVNSLSDIKQNGFYRLGKSTVKADFIGLPEFEGYFMPPATVVADDGSCYQVFIDNHGDKYRRGFDSNGNYNAWEKI